MKSTFKLFITSKIDELWNEYKSSGSHKDSNKLLEKIQKYNELLYDPEVDEIEVKLINYHKEKNNLEKKQNSYNKHRGYLDIRVNYATIRDSEYDRVTNILENVELENVQRDEFDKICEQVYQTIKAGIFAEFLTGKNYKMTDSINKNLDLEENLFSLYTYIHNDKFLKAIYNEQFILKKGGINVNFFALDEKDQKDLQTVMSGKTFNQNNFPSIIDEKKVNDIKKEIDNDIEVKLASIDVKTVRHIDEVLF